MDLGKTVDPVIHLSIKGYKGHGNTVVIPPNSMTSPQEQYIQGNNQGTITPPPIMLPDPNVLPQDSTVVTPPQLPPNVKSLNLNENNFDERELIAPDKPGNVPLEKGIPNTLPPPIIEEKKNESDIPKDDQNTAGWNPFKYRIIPSLYRGNSSNGNATKTASQSNAVTPKTSSTIRRPGLIKPPSK